MLWDGNRQIQEYKNDLTFTTVYEQNSFVPVARLVSKDDELKVYHYHNDHLGTPNELTDEDGNVVWLADYNAWGGVSDICKDFKYQKQTINGIEIDEVDLQPIRFQGQFFDSETGLHYNRFRYYDSDLGMFISRDPIGLLGGNNVFAYAPNPVNWIDPWGLKKEDCCKEKCKGRTEPKLPSGTIVKSGSISIVHYYKTNDHGPAHMHIVGGGPKVKIGPNGKPIDGSPELSAKQQKLVDANKAKIRLAGNKIGKWLKYKEECG